MQKLPSFERFKLSNGDIALLDELGFRLVAANVNLEKTDTNAPEFSVLKGSKGVYFWIMRYAGEKFKIYVGKTNSLPRRLKEYCNPFQPGVPNDYKMQHFQSWLREKFPGAELDLYFVEAEDNQAKETEVWRKTKPLFNERAGISSKDLQTSHSSYYRNIFENKLMSTLDHNSVSTRPIRQNKPHQNDVLNPVSKFSNHQMFDKALKSSSGKILETNHIKEIILAMFPEFSEGSLLPNDHAVGNKGACWCAGTEQRIFDRDRRGMYLVR